jgi:hypothetical protein
VVGGLQRFNAFSDRNAEFDRHLRADLLIIDDMGLKQLPEKSGVLLFEIIFRRHGLKSTLMTSNRQLDEWGKLIRDVPTAGAILDRFLEQSMVIRFKGRSYRLAGSFFFKFLQKIFSYFCKDSFPYSPLIGMNFFFAVDFNIKRKLSVFSKRPVMQPEVN